MASKPFWRCRRTLTGWLAMTMLFVLDLVNKEPVAAHMVAIVVAIAGANAAEGMATAKGQVPK